MEHRRPATSSGPKCPRPKTHRKRSNSFPLVEALGCSTPEAELILREGRAAVRSRQARQRGAHAMGKGTFNPRNHLKYLDPNPALSATNAGEAASTVPVAVSHHFRVPSDGTDGSTSTLMAPANSSFDQHHSSTVATRRPLGDYSANLAKFIQSQLNSIPSYHTAQSSISPSSCPELGFPRPSPQHSPMTWTRRPSDAPQRLELPPVRPPLRSAFSAWSTDGTDDETDDELPSLPTADAPHHVRSYTPSLLGYYEASSSFLLPSTPSEQDDEPFTAKRTSFPNRAELRHPSGSQQSTSHDGDYPSSTLSSRPQLISSSALSDSSASSASYFDRKQPVTASPALRGRIIAAVTPPFLPGKVVPATSPFEGRALANLHDLTVDENMRRVCVDGMSFDMVRDFSMPDHGLRRLPTPC